MCSWTSSGKSELVHACQVAPGEVNRRRISSCHILCVCLHHGSRTSTMFSYLWAFACAVLCLQRSHSLCLTLPPHPVGLSSEVTSFKKPCLISLQTRGPSSRFPGRFPALVHCRCSWSEAEEGIDYDKAPSSRNTRVPGRELSVGLFLICLLNCH